MTHLTPHPNLYFKSIDRYRFIAFFLVFIYHCFIYFKPVFNSIEEQNQFFVLQYFLTFVNESGDLGVNFFFTLSGFLISFLLLKEQENRSKIHLVSFYMRRILRIWPLYFLSIILGFIILPLLFPAVYSSSNSICIGWYALFLAGFKTTPRGKTLYGAHVTSGVKHADDNRVIESIATRRCMSLHSVTIPFGIY